jgi:hypothetical protein
LIIGIDDPDPLVRAALRTLFELDLGISPRTASTLTGLKQALPLGEQLVMVVGRLSSVPDFDDGVQLGLLDYGPLPIDGLKLVREVRRRLSERPAD